MTQMQETGEQVMGKGAYAKTMAKWIALKLAGGVLWFLAACGAVLTIGAVIAVGITLSDKEFGYVAVWLAMGIGFAGFAAGCGYMARRVVERATKLSPRFALRRLRVPPPPDLDGLADVPIEAGQNTMQAQEDRPLYTAMQTQARQAELAEAEAWSRERRASEAAKRQSRSPALTFVLDRSYPLLLFAAGVAMVGWNHWSIFHYHTIFYYPIVLGPPAFWGGLAALFDPHVINSHLGLTRLGRRLFLAAIALSILSVLFLIWLYAVYYRVR